MIREVYSTLFLLCSISGVTWGQYNIPDVVLSALKPKGLRVELPDSPGIQLFGFHGKLNDRLDSSKEGDIVGDVYSASNGKWVFEDPNQELVIGDKLYYWIYVQYNFAGYTKRDLLWEVTEFVGDTCTPSTTTATGATTNVCSGNLIFEDNFNQPSLDTTRWTPQKYIPSLTDDDHYEFVSYQNRPENVFIKNSVLYLKPIAAANRAGVYGKLDLTQGCTRSKPESCSYQQVGGYILPPVVSAKVVSKMSFKYGKVEVKAKLPLGDWIYPQIELIPVNKLPSYPKMLIAYSRGNLNLSLSNNEDIGSSLLFGGPARTAVEPERSSNLRSQRLAIPYGRDSRTYTLTWSPTRIDVMIGNNLYGTILSHEYAGFDTEYQIALGVGVGGNYDFPDDATSSNTPKPWRNFHPRTMKEFFDKKNFWIGSWVGDDVALQVDSVKVWAL
ncbi:GNBP1 [Trypoxylus dichotomus]